MTAPARDELAEVMVDDLFEAENCGELMTWDDNGTPWVNRDAIAETLVPKGWSKPRMVNSADELDALPPRSVIELPDGEIGMIMVARDKRHVVGYPQCIPTSELSDVIRSTYGDPIRVLFTPGDAG